MDEEEKKHHSAFPTCLSFLLNNPIRRHFDKNPEKVVRILGINDSSVVLDFGCGPGFYTVPFAKVAKQVVAVDSQEKMLKKAANYADKNGVKDKIQFFQTDGKGIPQLQGGVCDFVFLSFVYHEIDETGKERVLLELRRVMKPGARLAIMERTEKALIGPRPVNLEEVKIELARASFSGTRVIEVSKNVDLIIARK